jgi:hypothetical protein
MTCFRFLAICCFHVHMLSIVIPRYLISVFRGIWISFKVESCVELFRRVKVMEQDLFSFILICHFSNQVCRVLKWYWRSDAALLESSLTDNMPVLSVNVPRVVLVEVGRSDVYRTYKVRPKTLPCGTPAFIGCSSDFSFPHLLGTFGHLGRI